jgi:hypothetical protein
MATRCPALSRTTPLGLPVVPDVYSTYNGSYMTKPGEFELPWRARAAALWLVTHVRVELGAAAKGSGSGHLLVPVVVLLFRRLHEICLGLEARSGAKREERRESVRVRPCSAAVRVRLTSDR